MESRAVIAVRRLRGSLAPALTVWSTTAEYRVLLDLVLARHLMVVVRMTLYLVALGRSSGWRSYVGSGVWGSFVGMGVF